MEIRCRLNEILEEKQITQMELSEMTGFGQKKISNFASNKDASINKKTVSVIADALHIMHISELYEFW